MKGVGRVAITPKMIIVRTPTKINSGAAGPVEAPPERGPKITGTLGFPHIFPRFAFRHGPARPRSYVPPRN